MRVTAHCLHGYKLCYISGYLSYLSVFVLSSPLPCQHSSPISFSVSSSFPSFLILPLSLSFSLRLLLASSLWEYYAFMLALFITLNSLINYSINLALCLTFFLASLCLSLIRGLGGVLSLGLLRLRPGGFRDADQSDSQVEPLLLRPPALGHTAPGLASGVATETPPHPPCLTA